MSCFSFPRDTPRCSACEEDLARSDIVEGEGRCWSCREAVKQGETCERCDALTANPENEYGEFICDGCEQNAAETAWERHCEDFHDGGATQFRSLQEQAMDARRFK